MKRLIIASADQLRTVTCSYYQNNDFSRIERTVATVQAEVEHIIGTPCMEWLATDEGRQSEAWLACATAIGYMATMRYARLNDISHEDAGRKIKMDRDNEARPFEWQMARDERAHLDEYYRALDRLLCLLDKEPTFRQSDTWQQRQRLIVTDAACLTWLTGIGESPWFYHQLVPMLAESQHHVERAYGQAFEPDGFLAFENTDTLHYAAQKATALGAIVLMGQRTQLQAMPYALMQLVESNGGGNQRLQPTTDQLATYLRTVAADRHYWTDEMRRLRDLEAGQAATRLQMPDNDSRNKFMRL